MCIYRLQSSLWVWSLLVCCHTWHVHAEPAWHSPQGADRDWYHQKRIDWGCRDQKSGSTLAGFHYNWFESQRAQRMPQKRGHSSWDWCMLASGTCSTVYAMMTHIIFGSFSHPQWSVPMGIKKPLVNVATAAMTEERRNDLTGKEQMRAISRAIQVWFREMLTRRTWRYTRKSYDSWFINCQKEMTSNMRARREIEGGREREREREREGERGMEREGEREREREGRAKEGERERERARSYLPIERSLSLQ